VSAGEEGRVRDDNGPGLRHGSSQALLTVLLLTTLVSTVAGLRWSARHPLGTSWDESEYLNLMVQEVQDARDLGVLRAARMVRWTDSGRPPAYRVAAFPLAEAFGPNLRMLRALCLVVLLLTSAVIYRAARLVSEQSVAAVGAACFALSYAPLWASAHFGTDYVLYLGTAGLYSCLVSYAVRPANADAWLWAGLVASVALGALSKVSFLPIGLPAILAFLVVGWRGRFAKRVLWLVGTGAATGLLVTVPWWSVNYRAAMSLAQLASGFVRHDFPWLTESFWRLFGPPVAALVVLLAVALAQRRQLLRQAMSSSQRLVVFSTCVAGAVPLFLLHFVGSNHNMRLVSPALIPSILGASLLAHEAGVVRVRGAVAIAGTVVVLQGAYMIHHFETSTIDLWDWDPLLELCDQHGLRDPVVKHLGQAIAFNPPAVSYPWIRRGRTVHDSWLWRFEQGPIDWDRIGREVSTADVVVTAPGYTGDPDDKEPLDNQHNAELVSRLETLSAFEPPTELRLGRFDTRVLVFFRRRAR